MTRDLVAGIDSSTQSCKIVLRQISDGTFVAQASAPHPPTQPPCSEQSPNAWWQALFVAFSELSPYLKRIAAISGGGQGHGLVMLDEHNQPLRDAKLWNDTQSAKQAKKLLQELPAQIWAEKTGSTPTPALTISKLAWTNEHHPQLLQKAKRIMLPIDYLLYRLTGRAATERGGSSGTGYFNPFSNQWDYDLAALAAPNLDWPELLPDIINSGDINGEVQHIDGLEDLKGAIVGAGSGDNMTAALGMGIEVGDTVISLGTSGTYYGITNEGVIDPTGTINGYADATGAFLPMITTMNSAKVTDAFRRILNVSPQEYDALALEAEPGSGGVVLAPYLDGERTPNLPNATGMIFGLRSNMQPNQIARAAIEGVICNLLEGGDFLIQHGLKTDGRLIATGGGSQSIAYRQILADLTGRAVYTCALHETAAAGAAVQAAAALSGKSTKEMAAAWMPEFTLQAEPNLNVTEQARSVRENYRYASQTAQKLNGID